MNKQQRMSRSDFYCSVLAGYHPGGTDRDWGCEDVRGELRLVSWRVILSVVVSVACSVRSVTMILIRIIIGRLWEKYGNPSVTRGRRVKGMVVTVISQSRRRYCSVIVGTILMPWSIVVIHCSGGDGGMREVVGVKGEK